MGFESSGKFHLGHYLILKSIIKQRSKNPTLKVTILISDVHARLNFKENIEENTISAVRFMKAMLPFADVVVSSDMIKNPYYWKLIMEFINKVSFNDIYRAAPLDVKLNGFEELKNTPGNYFLYSVMQCVDGMYLGADTMYGGMDQRKIYMLGYDIYAKLKWPKFNLKLFPLLDLSGRVTKDVSKKMSKSKKCIPLDAKLLQSVKDQLEGKLTFWKHIITEEFLILYQEKTKTTFLNALFNDLSRVYSKSSQI